MVLADVCQIACLPVRWQDVNLYTLLYGFASERCFNFCNPFFDIAYRARVLGFTYENAEYLRCVESEIRFAENLWKYL